MSASPFQPDNTIICIGHWGPFASSGCSCSVLQLNAPLLTLIPLLPLPTSLSAIYTTSLLNQQWKDCVFMSCTCHTISNQHPLSPTSQASAPNSNLFTLIFTPSIPLNSSTILSQAAQSCMGPLLRENTHSPRATCSSLSDL